MRCDVRCEAKGGGTDYLHPLLHPFLPPVCCLQGMVGYGDKWLQERRARVDPFQPDTQAAGRQHAPPLSPDVAAAAAAVAHRHAPAAAALLAPEVGITSPDDTTAVTAAGGGTAAAPGAGGGLPDVPVIRASRSLSNSPHSSWAGFKSLEQNQAQGGTPRVLYSVPTAPGPLNLMGQGDGVSGGAGVLVSGRGELRRGHSLEWEPRVQSSSNNSSVVADYAGSAGGVGVSGNNALAAQAASEQQNAWQRFVHGVGEAAKRPAEWGGAVSGAVGGAVMHLAHAPGAGWNWVHGVVRGQQQQQQQGVGGVVSGSATSAAAGRIAKPGGVRHLAPAGPEDDGDPAAVAAAAAAAAAQQRGASPFTAGGGLGSRAASLHTGLTADFGGSIGSSNRGSSGAQRLQKLLVAAAVAAAVGAGVAHSRKKDARGQQEEVQQVLVERKQPRRGLGLRIGL